MPGEIFSVMRKSELAVGPGRVEPQARISDGFRERNQRCASNHFHRKGKENSAEGAQRAAGTTDTVYSRER